MICIIYNLLFLLFFPRVILEFGFLWLCCIFLLVGYGFLVQLFHSSGVNIVSWDVFLSHVFNNSLWKTSRYIPFFYRYEGCLYNVLGFLPYFEINRNILMFVIFLLWIRAKFVLGKSQMNVRMYLLLVQEVVDMGLHILLWLISNILIVYVVLHF